MVLDPIPQSLPVHFFGSRPQPPTSPHDCLSKCENAHFPPVSRRWLALLLSVFNFDFFLFCIGGFQTQKAPPTTLTQMIFFAIYIKTMYCRILSTHTHDPARIIPPTRVLQHHAIEQLFALHCANSVSTSLESTATHRMTTTMKNHAPPPCP